jgi:hypothetical protein
VLRTAAEYRLEAEHYPREAEKTSPICLEQLLLSDVQMSE